MPSLGDIRCCDRALSTQPDPGLLTCRSPFSPRGQHLEHRSPDSDPDGGAQGGTRRSGRLTWTAGSSGHERLEPGLPLRGQQRPQRGRAISRKSKASLEMDCKAAAIKTGSAQGQSSEQWDRIQSPEINRHTHRQLISHKGTDGTLWGVGQLSPHARCWEVSTYGRKDLKKTI